ncbi:hypothetical protein AB5J72_36990 [Streptomyces sp. CG1]|uniref:hypothetical protein n=1 Tax=Streptomyces sp. CG1 TaxID=1287523 RepID=UPI0034E2C6BF
MAAPASVTVETTENFEVRMNPAFLARAPDEGTMGSLLTEDPLVLRRSSYERWRTRSQSSD